MLIHDIEVTFNAHYFYILTNIQYVGFVLNAQLILDEINLSSITHKTHR